MKAGLGKSTSLCAESPKHTHNKLTNPELRGPVARIATFLLGQHAIIFLKLSTNKNIDKIYKDVKKNGMGFSSSYKKKGVMIKVSIEAQCRWKVVHSAVLLLSP